MHLSSSKINNSPHKLSFQISMCAGDQKLRYHLVWPKKGTLLPIDALRPRVWHFGRHFLRAKIHVSSAVKTFNQPIRRNRTRRSINVGVKHVFK